jgi:biotin carboxyl carrier protein
VKQGDLLSSSAARKMKSQLACDKPGRVVSGRPRNGDPLALGQTLFVIE